MTDARLQAMQHFINRFGSGNGWTGTVGEACAMIHELLTERETLTGPYKRAIELKNAELRCYRMRFPGFAFNKELLALQDVDAGLGSDYVDMMG